MGEHVRRGPRWIRAARIAARIAAGVVVAGLVVYLVLVGLDRADKVASSISGVIAVALFLASLLPGRAPAPLVVVEGSGAATATAVFSAAERAIWGWALGGGDPGFKAAAAITLNSSLRPKILPSEDLLACPYVEVDRRGAARPLWQKLVESGGYLSGGEMLLAKVCESIAHGDLDVSLAELWRLDSADVAVVLAALEAYTWRGLQAPVLWVSAPVPADYRPWDPYQGGRFETVGQA